MSGSAATAPVSVIPVEVLEVPTADLVRDPALQCRQEMSRATIEEYAERMREGVTFPALAAIRDEEGRLLLVDGWHRAAAHDQAQSCGWIKRETITVEVRPGTRRDALLAAVRANGNHGLPRSQADKRRAVMVLLADREWSGKSSRKLGELADVSHTFVNQVRERYGLRVGDALDLDWAAAADGEPTPAWRAILAGIGETRSWVRSGVEQRRRASGPSSLAELGRGYEQESMDAYALRQQELAVDPWPWAEDVTEAQKVSRAAQLDTVEDLEAACRYINLPRKTRDELYAVLAKIPTLKDGYSAERLAGEFAGRPKLVAAAQKAAAKHAARRSTATRSSWDLAGDIHRMKDAEKQGDAIRQASDDLLSYVRFYELLVAVQDGALRDRFDPQRVAPKCPAPDCDGWLLTRRPDFAPVCVRCSSTAAGFLQEAERNLNGAARLLGHEGFAVDVDGLVVDAAGVGVLRALHALMTAGDRVEWFGAAPPGVRAALRAWEDAPEPDVVGVCQRAKSGGGERGVVDVG